MAFELPRINDADDILRDRCLKGIEQRFDKDQKEKALIRIEEELNIIRNQGSASEFVAVINAFDAVDAQASEFCIRGTIPSLLITYAIGLSEVDPIDCSPNLYPEICYSIKGDRLPWFEFRVTPELQSRLFEYFDNYPGDDPVRRKCDGINRPIGVYIGEIDEGTATGGYMYDTFSIEFREVDNWEERLDRILNDEIFDICKPKSLEEHVKCLSFMHSTGAWEDNAEILFREGNIPFNDLISNREDVYEYLFNHGVDRAMAFTISEYVRKGRAKYKGWKYDMLQAMVGANISQWFIESCEKIQYLSIRAHEMNFAMKYYNEQNGTLCRR